MKGYKVFNPDWTCRGKRYAVGETATQSGEIELCGNGMHFCTKLTDCFAYYDADPNNKLAEIEAVGEVLQSDKDSKCCTDRLKVIKELSIAELLKDKDFCLEVVKQNPYQVRFMEGQDREVLLVAVKQNGWALDDVPEALKTQELCLAAVRQEGCALKYVPEGLKTLELCLTAVRQGGCALKYVPESLKTQELCMEAVQQEGCALKYVSDQTQEICRAAVNQRREAVRYVKDDNLKKELMT